MASCFIISEDEDTYFRNRLLSYSGVVKGGKMILTLKVEVGSQMAFELEALEAILRAHSKKVVKVRAKAVAVSPRRIGKSVMLALPAPDRSE